jgi:hypothetical protein
LLHFAGQVAGMLKRRQRLVFGSLGGVVAARGDVNLDRPGGLSQHCTEHEHPKADHQMANLFSSVHPHTLPL